MRVIEWPKPPTHINHGGGPPGHQRRARAEPCRLAAGSRACRCGPDPVARAAEGADPQRSAGTQDVEAVRDPAIKVRGDEEFLLAVPEPTPAHNEPQDIPLRDRVRGRASAGRRQARRPRRPSGGGQSRRDLGQRVAPSLRRQPVGHRRRRPAGHRPPHRQGYVRAAGGRQDRCRPRGPRQAVRGAQHRAALSRDRQWRSEDGRGQGRRSARPLFDEPQEDRDRRRRTRETGRNPLAAARNRCARQRWSNAGWRPAGLTRSACIWPRSAIPCSATRSTARRKNAPQVIEKIGLSRARRCTQRSLASSTR